MPGLKNEVLRVRAFWYLGEAYLGGLRLYFRSEGHQFCLFFQLGSVAKCCASRSVGHIGLLTRSDGCYRLQWA